MSYEQTFRVPVSPISDNTLRPIWSVMIPTYNCASYLQHTLTSILIQDPGPELMQIEVIDDCSTKDDPAAVVNKLGAGRVNFYQQPYNVGHIKNFQTCLERSRGCLVHLLHGDDYVRQGFYTKMQRAFRENPDIGAAFCRQIFADEQGHWQKISPLEQPKSGILESWLNKIAIGQRVQTPSIVVKRQVYEKLGGFDQRLIWVEDWEMWVRIAAHYPVWYEVEPLAVYRVHSISNSGRYTRTGENMQDVRRAIAIIKSYLSPNQARQLMPKAAEHWAITALYAAKSFALVGQKRSALLQMREAVRCRLSLGVVLRFMLYSIYLMGGRYLQK